MKKKIFLMFLVMATVTMHYSATAQSDYCEPGCSSDLTACQIPSACGTPSCASVGLRVPHFQFVKSGNTVTVQQMGICWAPGYTRNWTLANNLGMLMNLSLRPSSTRTFNMSNGLGATFQCVVQSSGLWRIQLISGPVPTSAGTTLTGGSYTL